MTVHFDALRIVFEPVKIGALHVEPQCRTPSLDSAAVDTCNLLFLEIEASYTSRTGTNRSAMLQIGRGTHPLTAQPGRQHCRCRETRARTAAAAVSCTKAACAFMHGTWKCHIQILREISVGHAKFCVYTTNEHPMVLEGHSREESLIAN